ncbi:MAG: methyltransferase domain-containing protein [Candidatus Lokiarchaeota archaeon]|nr:methyltransferase domain-containing protein [Candidatus Lokiarchaeota archaeon]
MYKKLAKYYDLIYHWKDYEKEAYSIKDLIKKYKKTDGNKLLDVGCGTGKHLEYFKDDFSCTGIDINNEMVEVAKSKVKYVIFEQGDMIDFNLKTEFDVILCLFSSIGYVKTYSNLEKTIKNFANHLNKGGVLIIEPWFTKSTYWVGYPGMTTYDGKDIKIARLNTTKIKGDLSIMEMHYLIVEKDKDVIHFVDTHELGLFEIDKTLEFIEKAGFKAEFLLNGLMEDRGLFIGVKLE